MATLKTELESLITNYGTTVSVYANTEKIDAYSGSAINSYGGAVSVGAIVYAVKDNEKQAASGVLDDAELVMVTNAAASINVFDKVTYSSVDYEVINYNRTFKDNIGNGATTIGKRFYLKRLVTDGS